MKESDWKIIRHRLETGDASARELGKEYGVSHTTINNRARKEGWKKHGNKVSTKRFPHEKWKVETRKLTTRHLPKNRRAQIKNTRFAPHLMILISLLTPMNSAFLTSRLSLRCLLLKGKSRQRHTDWLGMKGKETLHG